MNTADTRQRLLDIEKQIASLKEEQATVKAQWDAEKELIHTSRRLKSELEELRVQAENYERSGDYGKVAEIRYGKIAGIEKELEENNRKIEARQASGDLIMKEEIDAGDIADIVSRWTGIPVSKMLQSAPEAARHRGRAAPPRGRPGRGGAGGQRRGQALPRRHGRREAPDRLVHFPRPDRRRQNRAGPNACRISFQ
jgi:ATP-dependent Clp protease ATP-binding subunit ClpA